MSLGILKMNPDVAELNEVSEIGESAARTADKALLA
jgi:hypothetical protein